MTSCSENTPLLTPLCIVASLYHPCTLPSSFPLLNPHPPASIAWRETTSRLNVLLPPTRRQCFLRISVAPSALRASPYPTPMATQDFTSSPNCRRWNQAVCRGFLLCSYKHACSSCGKRGHKVAECSDKPNDSGTATARPQGESC